PPRSTLLPYTTLFRSRGVFIRLLSKWLVLGLIYRDTKLIQQRVAAFVADKRVVGAGNHSATILHPAQQVIEALATQHLVGVEQQDRKSTRLNSSHVNT